MIIAQYRGCCPAGKNAHSDNDKNEKTEYQIVFQKNFVLSIGKKEFFHLMKKCFSYLSKFGHTIIKRWSTKEKE
ncbi:MAG TPA: hypothetical protein DEP42_03215 [Ruminococcaceae bacterium]|nr:hypothetical protein [Oscillospiraceae bacterium]